MDTERALFENSPRPRAAFRRKDATILLYVLFLTAFLASFLATFRGELDSAISETTSYGKVSSLAVSLSEGLQRIRSDNVSGLASVTSHSFDSPAFDGRMFVLAAFSGADASVRITGSGGAASFEGYVVSGAPAVFSVRAPDGSVTASGIVSVGQAVNFPYPAATGSVSVSSLGGYSVVEIDRKSGGMTRDDLPVRAYRRAGAGFEYVGTFRPW